MASFIVEAMVCGIHELIRGHNFCVLVEIREKPQNYSPRKWSAIRYRERKSGAPLIILRMLKILTETRALKSQYCSGFFALLTQARHAVKFENRSGLTFCVHRAEADSLSS